MAKGRRAQTTVILTFLDFSAIFNGHPIPVPLSNLQEASVRTGVAAGVFALILSALCPSLEAQTTKPTFLFLLEGKGTPVGTIHVFSVNSSTGALTEAPGSPFNSGLVPKQLVVDPTGRFVYVTNSQSQDTTALSVDPASGALTELPGSPFPIGAAPITSAVDPTGRFLYVFAVQTVYNVDEEFLYEYTIDNATGVLTAASSSPTVWQRLPGMSYSSIVFSLDGTHAYLGQVAGGNVGAQIVVCSVDFNTGIFTSVGSVQPATTGEAAQAAISPNGSFLYSINSIFSQADAFSIGTNGVSLTEISGSPYSLPYGPTSLVVHPSGNFLYTTNSNNTFQAPPSTGPIPGSIYAFSISSGSGALAQISGSPYATAVNPLSIVVDPTGSFAYWTSTANSTSNPHAQIIGYAINASTGALTPLSWSPWTDAAASDGGQLVIASGPALAPNPVPMISSLSPPSTIATDTAFTLQVNGANFVPGATVYFAGQRRTTTFVSSTQLNANILGSDIDNDGTAVVFVFNPLPGGGDSTSVGFRIAALAPIISFISPATVTVAQSGITMQVFGSNFVASSVINFNGTPLQTTFVIPTALTAQITPAQIVAQGTASISVTTPSNGIPGGGTSNIATMTIVAPPPPFSVSSISPVSATAGDPGFTLTVNGTGFVQGSLASQSSQVSFNLMNMSTTVVGSTELTASIPASAIAIAGNPYVIVTNPNGVNSARLPFTVNNPQPGGGAITPPSRPAGSGDLTLSVTGMGFVQGPPGSTVYVNGNPRVTSFVSPTSLLATLLPGDLAKSGTLNITVVNPPPGGGRTAVILFTVADFNVTATFASRTLSPGQQGTYDLSLKAINGTLGHSVTFSAAGMPPQASALFTPSSVPAGNPGTAIILSITTRGGASGSFLRTPYNRWAHGPLITSSALLIGTMCFAFWALGGATRRNNPKFLIAMLLVMLSGFGACGGFVGAPGTPPGTYTITVNATSGSAQITTKVILKVM